MAPEFYVVIDSPVGELCVHSDGSAITAIDFGSAFSVGRESSGEAPPVLATAVVQLREYFSGLRQSFDLPLAPLGTDFQQDVWAQLREIRFGEIKSYGALARAIGRPGASRAVGAANGSNPLSIVQPCHRVVGSDGRLTGFGGGLPIKRLLLIHEGWTLVEDRLPRPGADQPLLPFGGDVRR